MNQTFETIDWPTEASRLMAAFEIDEACEFVEVKNSDTYYFSLDSISRRDRPSNDQWEIVVVYLPNGRIFEVLGDVTGQVKLSWENTFRYGKPKFEPGANLILASAFFKLGFLTPEIEAALKVSVTAHQKLEWTLAFDERMKSAGQI